MSGAGLWRLSNAKTGNVHSSCIYFETDGLKRRIQVKNTERQRNWISRMRLARASAVLALATVLVSAVITLNRRRRRLSPRYTIFALKRTARTAEAPLKGWSRPPMGTSTGQRISTGLQRWHRLQDHPKWCPDDPIHLLHSSRVHGRRLSYGNPGAGHQRGLLRDNCVRRGQRRVLTRLRHGFSKLAQVELSRRFTAFARNNFARTGRHRRG